MTGPALGAALARGPVVLDGGLATQLAAAGHDLSDELWSARLLHDDPAAVVAAHLAFLRAGASVVTTASYQATVAGLTRRGLDAAGLLRRSVDLARQACAQARELGIDRPLWIAASVGPYGAMLADGSEYRGRYGLSRAQLADFHRPRMEILAEAGADVLACETVPDVREAEALLTVLADLDTPAWLSYTVDSTGTRAGQSLEEAFGLARGVDGLLAVGVNCCAPDDATAAVPVAAAVSGKPVVVYPNSGERWDALARGWTGESTVDESAPVRWVRDGARLVGGCCRVGPAGIGLIRNSLDAAGAPI